jgi:hypothetical protein
VCAKFRVDASITNHLRDFAPCMEKFKVVQNVLIAKKKPPVIFIPYIEIIIAI